jgi:hypothetical protein
MRTLATSTGKLLLLPLLPMLPLLPRTRQACLRKDLQTKQRIRI